MMAWDAITVAAVARISERVQRPSRRQAVERIAGGFGIVNEQGPLPEVVQEQRHPDEAEPVDLDRPLAEMSHVRVERLSSRRDKEDGTENEKSVEAVSRKEVERVGRIDRGEHGRVADDPGDAQDRESAEPDEHDRPEHGTDPAGPVSLEEKEADEDADRDRHDEFRERRGRDLETLDCAQDGDRGRDDAVAVEERRSEETERHDEASESGSLTAFLVDQTHEGQDSSLPPVVHPQHVDVIFESDHDHERPEDQRQDAENVGVRRRDPVGAVKTLLQGIERTRPDVAVDDAQRSERHKGEVTAARRCGVWMGRVALGRRCLHEGRTLTYSSAATRSLPRSRAMSAGASRSRRLFLVAPRRGNARPRSRGPYHRRRAISLRLWTHCSGSRPAAAPHPALAHPEVPGRARLRRSRRGLPLAAAGAARAEGPVHGRRALRGRGSARPGTSSRSSSISRRCTTTTTSSLSIDVRDCGVRSRGRTTRVSDSASRSFGRCATSFSRTSRATSTCGGEKTLRRYSRPFDLSRFDRIGWMTAEEDLWEIPNHLVGIRHYRLLSAAQEKALAPVSRVLFRRGPRR